MSWLAPTSSAPAVETQDGPAKIVFILGMSYSGSTLLARALGETPGTFYGGELRHVWRRGISANWTCTCGRPFRDCEFWSSLCDEWIRGTRSEFVPDLIRWDREYARTRRFPALILRSFTRPNDTIDGFTAYRRAVGNLYRDITRTTGSDLIIDSSKNPAYCSLVRSLSPNVYVIHLVRDPRANVFSSYRRHVPSLPLAARVAARWVSWHITIELLFDRTRARYMRVRYEDLAQSPTETLLSVLRFLGEEARPLSLEPDGTARFTDGHIFSGNRARFTRGRVAIEPDDEWKTRLPSTARRVVTAITLPLLIRYGYFARMSGERHGRTRTSLESHPVRVELGSDPDRVERQ